METKRNRINYIDERASELAHTGLYSGWLAIEHALAAEGYPEAKAALDVPGRRDRLDRVCAAFIRLGTTKIRLTGGEPLVRRDVMSLFRTL